MFQIQSEARPAASLTPQPSSASVTTLAQVMLPPDANPHGNVHGGTLMKLADTAGGTAATRHTRLPMVTVVMDSMTFERPVFVGDLVELTARVTWAGSTSLEAEVTICAESTLTGDVRHVSRAYFVYVAIDEHGHPTPIRPLAVETDEDGQRWAAAVQRRERRLLQAGRAPSA